MKVENENALKAFNEGWDKAHTTGDVKPPDIGGGDPNLGGGGDSNLLTSLQQNTASVINTMNQPYIPPPIPTTGDTCDQCHLLHPPVRPGEMCPNAVEQPEPTVKAPHVPAKEPHQTTPVHEAPPVQVTPVHETPQKDKAGFSSAGSAFEVKPEPKPLADNNIPTEIHVNKYLKTWGDMIQTHCKENALQNTKKLMRHLTIEITDFLETYKGK